MKQTTKVFTGLGVVLILLIAGGIVFIMTNLDSLVARVIEQQGRMATQTDVDVDSVSLDLRNGKAGISSLTVANPHGFSDNPAISLRGFGIELDPLSAMSDPLVISDVSVDGATLRIEQVGTKNNLRTILSSLQERSGREPASESAGTKVIIDRFRLTGASAELHVPELGEDRELRLPEIVLTDIGRATNGATAAAVAQQILTPIVQQALKSAAAGQLENAIRQKLGQGLDQKLDDKLDDKLGTDTSKLTKGLLDRPGERADDETDDNP